MTKNVTKEGSKQTFQPTQSESNIEILEMLNPSLFEKVQGNKTFIAKIIHEAVQLRIKIMKGLKKSSYEIKVMEHEDTYAFVAIDPKIDAKENYASKLNKFNDTIDFAFSAFQTGQKIRVEVPEQVAIDDEREGPCEMIDGILHATSEELQLIEDLQSKVDKNDTPYNGRIYRKIDDPNKFLINSKPDVLMKLELIIQSYHFNHLRPTISASLKDAEIAEMPLKQKILEFEFHPDLALDEITPLLEFMRLPPDERASFSASVSAELQYDFKKRKNRVASAIIEKIEF